MNDAEVVIYESAKVGKFPVKTDGETVWLSQQQMVELFGRDQSVIARHIRNIFKEGELVKDSVYAKFAYTAADGKTYQVDFYNLDVVISVGYRVKSQEGVRFRQWATKMLRELILRRVDEMKEIGKLKRRMDDAEADIKQIKGGMNYLVKQITAPSETPRKRIGFGVMPGETSTTSYGRAK